MGDVSDLSNFIGAVIDDRAFAKHKAALDRAAATDALQVVAGGTYDDSEGYFVRPTLIVSDDPTDEIFTTEYFGPILGVHVYDDADYAAVLKGMENSAPYGLTGAVIAQDRHAVAEAAEYLRFAAGNFYVNDKPTGAVVGQQPFGGARASGTNDKAGSMWNLIRWASPAVDEGDLRAADRLPLPAPGLSDARPGRPWSPQGCPGSCRAPGINRARRSVYRTCMRPICTSIPTKPPTCAASSAPTSWYGGVGTERS